MDLTLDLLQVARLLPSPAEGGLAAFFEHLSHTQVSTQAPVSHTQM